MNYAEAPPPCSLAPALQTANFAIHYLGTISGCSQSGGACLPGEPITFQAVSIFDCGSTGCFLGYSWDFTDGTPIAGGVTLTHLLPSAATYDVHLTITSAIATHASITQPVLVSASLPAFNDVLLAALACTVFVIGAARLAR